MDKSTSLSVNNKNVKKTNTNDLEDMNKNNEQF